MKNFKNVSTLMVTSMATLLVVLADMISMRGSFAFWGEPKCPKNLLK